MRVLHYSKLGEDKWKQVHGCGEGSIDSVELLLPVRTGVLFR